MDTDAAASFGLQGKAKANAASEQSHGTIHHHKAIKKPSQASSLYARSSPAISEQTGKHASRADTKTCQTYNSHAEHAEAQLALAGHKR